MKKKWIIVLMALCMSFATVAFVGCGENPPSNDDTNTEQNGDNGGNTQNGGNNQGGNQNNNQGGNNGGNVHTHIFDKQVTQDTYKATNATCTTKATYYYSCVCGAKGTATFEYGDFGTHNMVNGECTVCYKKESQGLSYRLSNDNTYYIVTGIGTCTDTDLIVPSIYNGLPVKEIGNSAFFGCDSLTSVEIPNSVETIGEGSFYECTSLTSVEIGDNVTLIGKYAFRNCTSLTSVEIPDSVTSIGYGAFYECTSLTSVVIGDSVETIDEYAFSHCDSLTSVEIPDSVTSIGNYAFSHCDSLTSVEIPDSVTSIGNYAFSHCDSLTSVVIGDSVETIDEFAFSHCDSLTSVVIPDSVTSIGYAAFYNCSSLTSVVIGDSVETIGSFAFHYCYKLVEVVNKSPSITVEKGSRSNGWVGYYALAVYNSGDTFTTKLSNDNGYIIYTNSEEKILVNYIGEETDLTLPTYITKIKENAFYNCSNLTSVVIGDSVQTIGDMAFYDCDNLTSVVLGDSVETIGYDAFYNCSSLTSVYYKGTASDWNSISIRGSIYGNYNFNATRYYYVENEADVPTDGSNYWHYVDGVPTKW